MIYKYFLLIFIIKYLFCYIVFPFKNINENNNENFLNNYLPQNIITDLEIGNPSKKININISPTDYRFYIANNNCYNNSISYYYYSNSSSFNIVLPAISPFDDLENGFFAYDKVKLYNDINLSEEITIDEFRFHIFEKYRFRKNSNIFCGNLGLSINFENLKLDYYDEDDYLPSIFSILKSLDIISKYTWTYEYFDNNDYINNIIKNKAILDEYDGILIIGKYPHEYNPNYLGHDLINIYSDKKKYITLWNFNFNKIYFQIEEDIINKDNENFIVNLKETQAQILFNINYIISTKEFFEFIKMKYFNFYINKNICSIINKNYKNNIYNIIYCNSYNFSLNDIKKFPSIYFMHYEFNYTFILTYEDLFKIENNEIYFLIYFQETNSNLWKLGKLFLKKYHFIFNIDSSGIYFYSNYDEILFKKKNDFKKGKSKRKMNIKKIMLYILIFIFSLLFGIILSKTILNKNIKNKAHELQDKYINFENNINKNGQIKTNIEMKIKL